MANGSDFDPRPDEVLGRFLREHLQGPDEPAFRARLQSALVTADRDNAWDILGRWALPGLVAAGVAASALAWVGLRGAGRPSDAADPAFVQVIVAGQQQASELLVAAVLEGR